jgi:hypothetical protein
LTVPVSCLAKRGENLLFTFFFNQLRKINLFARLSNDKRVSRKNMSRLLLDKQLGLTSTPASADEWISSIASASFTDMQLAHSKRSVAASHDNA